jgi:hypothetical protein
MQSRPATRGRRNGSACRRPENRSAGGGGECGEQVLAGSLAARALLGGRAAVLVVLGVALALGGAGATCRPATTPIRLPAG